MSAPAPTESWRSFLSTFFWIGLNSFGGPVAQIGVMHQEAVEKRRWLSDEQFLHLLNFANILPGPEALELAIHLGRLRKGVWGGIAAGLLFIWPGFVSLTLLAWVAEEFGSVPAVAGFLEGIRPAGSALIAFTAFRLARRTMKSAAGAGLCALSFSMSYFLEVPFIPILVGAGVGGIFLARFRPTPTALRGFWWMLIVGALLTVPALSWGTGQQAPPTEAVTSSSAPPEPGKAPLVDIAAMNLKAALVTFGGAYTALPYFREQAVVRHQWITHGQMLDALALGESTPGPLISVGVYVSYLAGGFAGASVGALFLFLPSFVLVLGLGRYAERLERWPRARDFLWGVSAGTLGLILALSAHIAPRSLTSLASWVLAIAAVLALWRLKASPVVVVLSAGTVGVLLHLW